MCTVQEQNGPQVDEADLQRKIDAAGTSVTPATPSSTDTAPQLETSGNDTNLGRGNPPTKSGIPGGETHGTDPGVAPATTPDTPPVAGTSPPATPATYTPNSDGSFNGQSYLDAHPDVLAEYNRLIGTADRNSPWFAEHGLDQGPTGFAAWHANNGGYSTSGAAGGAGGASGAGTATDTLTSLTSSFNDTIKQLQDSTAAQIAALNNNSTSLTSSIADMQKGFATSQQELLDNMNKAAAQQSKSFTDALKNLSGASGQASKKPNYGKALARNKDLNGSGIGATMLTGPSGVTPGGAALGTTSLLGS